MKISFAANHGEIGGGEVMLLAMAEAARDLGHDVEIVAPSTPTPVLDSAVAKGFRVVGVHGAGARRYLTGLRAWSAHERAGLLWCNGLRPAAATAGQRDRVVHLHQRPVGKFKPLAWVATRGARRVVVPSELMRAQVGLGAVVMENWTAPLTLDPQSLPPENGPFVIGFLGRQSEDKGVHVLAEAVRELDRQSPGNYRLFLAGEPRFVDPEETKRVEASLAPIAHLTTRPGWVTREEFFSAVDLAVFPSVWDEPFGLVAAEAMSARSPFVITRAGALPSVAGSSFPWVAEPNDRADLARVIAEALSSYTDEQLERSLQRWNATYSPEAGRLRLASVLAQLQGESP